MGTAKELSGFNGYGIYGNRKGYNGFRWKNMGGSRI
jgi:hypothetical protein